MHRNNPFDEVVSNHNPACPDASSHFPFQAVSSVPDKAPCVLETSDTVRNTLALLETLKTQIDYYIASMGS